MQSYAKRVVEKVIDWSVPLLCASVLVGWKSIPAEAQHYWPVACVAITGAYGIVMAIQNRREVTRLKRIHEDADKRETEARATNEAVASALRAMLDDAMGELYERCVFKGYTTEDERRRYARMHKAYEGIGGNGEAARRKIHFDAIPDEAEWKAMQQLS